MNKKRMGLLLILMVTSLLSAKGQSEERNEIKIGLLPDLNSIPFIIGDKEGYFAQEGIDLEITLFRSAKDRDTAFFSKRLDAVSSDLLSAAFAANRGFEIDPLFMTEGSFKLLASAASGIVDKENLRGASVGISKNTIIEYALDRLVENGGLEKVIIPQIPLRLEMLSKGKIDLALLPEPLASVAVAKGAKVLDDTANHNIEMTVILSHRSIKEKKTPFIRAYNKAIAYLENNKKEIWIDYVSEKLEYPPVAAGIMEIPSYSKATSVNPKELETLIIWMRKKDLVEEELTAFQILGDN